MTNNLTRTFLVPEAKLPDEFGLTESVGTLPRKRAKAFVADVRAKMAQCSKKQMGTKVTRLRDVQHGRHRPDGLEGHHRGHRRQDPQLPDGDRPRRHRGRPGRASCPSKDFTIGNDAFEELIQRALDRVAKMPAPTAR